MQGAGSRVDGEMRRATMEGRFELSHGQIVHSTQRKNISGRTGDAAKKIMADGWARQRKQGSVAYLAQAGQRRSGECKSNKCVICAQKIGACAHNSCMRSRRLDKEIMTRHFVPVPALTQI
eukprot:6202172-Pleurochrysis_carterae.AAC.2